MSGVGGQGGLGEAFAQPDEILRIAAEGLRAGHDAHVRRRAQRLSVAASQSRAGRPSIVARVSASSEPPGSRPRRTHDVGAAVRRRPRRGEAGGAGADDEHVAMIEIARVAVGVGGGRRRAEAGGAAHNRLVDRFQAQFGRASSGP